MKKYQKKPYFKHGCPSCVFLGRFRKHDLYVCLSKGKKISTLLGRFNSEPSDYVSGLDWTIKNRKAKRTNEAEKVLLEALRRAETAGYYV